MTTIAYVGHGVEIADDAAWLNRRKLEFEDDAARWAHRSGLRLRWRKARRRVGAMAAVVARWR